MIFYCNKYVINKKIKKTQRKKLVKQAIQFYCQKIIIKKKVIKQ